MTLHNDVFFQNCARGQRKVVMMARLIPAVCKYVKLKCARTDSTEISVTEIKKAKTASLKQQLTFDTAVFKIPRLSWLLVVFLLRENILKYFSINTFIEGSYMSTCSTWLRHC